MAPEVHIRGTLIWIFDFENRGLKIRKFSELKNYRHLYIKVGAKNSVFIYYIL